MRPEPRFDEQNKVRLFWRGPFIMDDHEDLQQPSVEQRSICVMNIMIHLLYVHTLEIIVLTLKGHMLS